MTKNKLWKVLCLIVLAVCIADPKYAEPDTIGIVAGVVINSATGKTIDKATIKCDDGTKTQSKDGYYVLIVKTGVHNITASALGYKRKTESVTVPTGDYVLLDFILSPRCPFAGLLKNGEDIDMLRELRDKRLVNNGYGMYLIALYYKHAAETVSLLEQNPELKNAMRQLVQDNREAIQEFTREGIIVQSEGNEKAVIDFLNSLKAAAGIQLRNDIDMVLQDMESGYLRNLLENMF